MRVAPTGTSERERRFQEVAAEYLEAREAGRPDDLSALLARHPDLADELAAFVAGQDEVGRLAAPLREALTLVGSAEPARLPGTLGDFRLIREVGRGGMGVVYEAEQLSLDRRVALKVLPFAATLDPRHLQRFHNEARAAAGLHHTNIVPVYGVGSERGVHYYAMQFIDGRTLADLIAEQRRQLVAQTPTTAERAAASAPTPAPAAQTTRVAPRDAAFFRRVAEWGIQAAEALDCAHSLGIVHRDVKPANLLVDTAGRLWVTDFGLAHVQKDIGLTLTGDLVGTLRYMSPEQALGQRTVIDHRTDIYSLGATLYEVLALQPAFGGNDRQELLRQIALEEPPPLRRLDRAVPAELEVIVLKGLEKNADDRYATAQELADDLRRFLQDKPIRARRPSLSQRAVKWARRHKPLVWTVSLVLLVAAALGSAGGLWWLQQRAAAETAAERALKEADELQQAGNVPGALAAVHGAEPLLRSGLLREALQRHLQQRGEDLTMAARLEDIRLQEAAVKDGHFDSSGADAAYAAAFRDYGIDVTPLRPEEAALRIRARSIRVELAAALGDWALACRKTRPKRDTTWKDLLRIARLADPDPGRDRPRLEALEDRCLLSAGALDPTFGSNGIATLGGFSGAPGSGVVIQADGKIVSIGSATMSNGRHAAAVIRFNANGSLDTGFGSQGEATAALSRKLNADPYAVALQADGKILIAGRTATGTTASEDFFLARFNVNGTLDTTFGSGGMVHTDFGNTPDEANAITIQPADGRIVVAGRNVNGAGEIARYNTNGTLDTTFGSRGKVVLTADGFGSFNGVALQADGKVVVAGAANPAGSPNQAFGVVRYTANGTLDPTFGSGGIAVTTVAPAVPDQATAVAIQQDGKIVAAGITSSSTSAEVGLVRYNVGVAGQADGSLDTTFGQGGVVTTAISGAANDDALALQADGKIIVVGDGNGSFVLVRYNVDVAGQPDGSLDATFGNGGIVTASGGEAYGVAIYPGSDPTNAGKIVVSGLYTSGVLEVTRYLPSEPEIGSFMANPNPVTAGSSVTLTAANITDANPNSTIAQVEFYYYDSAGTQQVLGSATQTSPGVWTWTGPINLAIGSYTIYAQAEDSYGVFGDPFSLTLTVQ